MSATQTEAKVDSADVIKTIEKMDIGQLDDIAARVQTLRASKFAPVLSTQESELISEINQGFPEDVQKRFNHLVRKRQAEIITAKELDELIELTERSEEMGVRRLRCLIHLADVRSVSLDKVMKDLGLKPINNARRTH